MGGGSLETKGLTAAMQPSVRWSRDSTALVHGKQHAGLAEGPRVPAGRGRPGGQEGPGQPRAGHTRSCFACAF